MRSETLFKKRGKRRMTKKGHNNEKDIIGIKAEPLMSLLGAYKYSKDDWSTIAFILNRELLENSQVKFREQELLFNCIYFLGGDQNNTEKIYVGQAKKRNNGDSVLPRLREHTKNTNENYHDIWKYAVVVTNTKDTWGPTELNALEHIFYNIIPKENNLNGNNPNAGSYENGSEYEEKVRQITAYLTAIGLRTFSNTDDAPKIQVTEDNSRVEDLQKGKASIPEIVTPDRVVKQMVDMLPDDVWNDSTTFLDPACKGGEYLREIFDRLMDTESLQIKYKSELERAIHILDKQLFGIALSGVSKDRTVRKLNGYDKNIIVVPYYIDILKSKTRECVVKGKVVSFKEKLAYEFRRDEMNFDVVIGNPPYQEITGGGQQVLAEEQYMISF